MLLAGCAGAFALDPSLDVSQYAHTAWKIRDGFTKGYISIRRTDADSQLIDIALPRSNSARRSALHLLHLWP